MWVFLAVALLLLALRFAGESRFAVQPQALSPVKVSSGVLKTSAEQLLARGDGSPNLYVPLGDAPLALLSRILLARYSSGTLDVRYYLFHDDESGRALLGELISAAERGVQVRLLLDDMDTVGRNGLFIRLAGEYPNLQVRVFNPAWLRTFRIPEYLARFPRATRRMHNKSMTADGISTIVGGRNIGDEYFHLHNEVAFTDFDVLASGPVALQVNQAFEVYWRSGLAFDVAMLGQAANDQDYQQWLALVRADNGRFHQKIAQHKPALQRLVEGSLRPYYDHGVVLHDPPDKVIRNLSDQQHNMAADIASLLSRARTELLIVSPYFIPGEYGLSLLKHLRERGVSITIISNSMRANDVFAVHAGYMQYRKPLLEMGVKLYEIRQQPDSATDRSLLGSRHASLHAKSFLIDRQRIFVGSFNLDPRSAIHNTEMGVVFDSPEYAGNAYALLTPYLGTHTYRVELQDDGGLQWVEGRNGNATEVIHPQEPGVAWWEKTLLVTISWLPVEWLL